MRKASNGPGHRAHGVLVEGDLLGQVEVADDDARRRRRRSGRRRTWSWSARRRRRRGSAAAGGTARRRCCRRPAARRPRGRPTASASMSPMLSSGLVGVSTQTSRVWPGRIAARTASTSETGGRGCARGPTTCRDLVEEPEGAAVRVVGDAPRGRPGVQSARTTVSSAARPEANAKPRSPSSSAASAPSRAVRVGLARAAVLVAAAQAADAVLLVGRGRVDRRDHRAGRRVGLVAGVDRTRLEAGLVPVLLLAHRAEATLVAGCTTAAAGARRERTGATGVVADCAEPDPTRRSAACPSSPATSPSSSPPEQALPGRSERTFHLAEQHRVLDAPLVTDEAPEGYEVAIFGLGCFWGAEEIYWQIPGVWSTSVGYAGGTTPNPSYEEVCSRPHRPHRGRPGRLRPGAGVRTPTWSRRSSRCTTRPRACARATTSARSTARRSTSPRPSRSRPPAS